MESDSRKAWTVLITAGSLDVLFGAWFAGAEHLAVVTGWYWAITTAVTVGSDVQPHNSLGRLITVLVALTVIPLFAATWSLITAKLASSRLDEVEGRLKRHAEQLVAGLVEVIKNK